MSPRSDFSKLGILALLLAACGPASSSNDSGPVTSEDSGVVDSGPAVTHDAGPVDSGPIDSGPTDSGSADAGPVDAGATDAGPIDGGPIEVQGAWVDDYACDGLLNDEHATISDQLWQEDTVVSYDNATRSAITWTYAQDQYNPDTFNKIVWTRPDGGSWFWCEVDYGETTEAAAVATTATADPSNPSTCGCPAMAVDGGGCGGFSWTQMVSQLPPLPIDGKWTDSASGSVLQISDVSWGSNPIDWYANQGQLTTDAGVSVGGPTSGGWIVTKNVPTDGGNTSTYNLIVWLPAVSGVVSYCIIDIADSSAENAQMTSAMANPSSPSTSGCNGSKWATLTAVAP